MSDLIPQVNNWYAHQLSIGYVNKLSSFLMVDFNNNSVEINLVLFKYLTLLNLLRCSRGVRAHAL